MRSLAGYSPAAMPLRNGQYHFPELLAVLKAAVGVGGALKRQYRIDYGLQQAALEKLEGSEKLRFLAHERTENRKLPTEYVVDVDLGFEARGRTARHQASAGLHAENALLPGSRADVLENNVHAAPAREPFHLAGKLPAMRHDIVGAEPFSLRE